MGEHTDTVIGLCLLVRNIGYFNRVFLLCVAYKENKKKGAFVLMCLFYACYTLAVM